GEMEGTVPDSALHEIAVLEEVDRDGAIREAAAAVNGDTRAQFIRKGGILAGAGLGIAAIPGGIALAQGTPKGDVKILNYALTLEYLEAAFYAEANAKGKLKGIAARFARVVGAHESQHVAALQKALGTAALKKPSFDFKGTTAKTGTFLATAMTLEDTGVSAYQGQAGNIKTPAVLASAGAILAVEARHAAWVRDIIGAGKSPSPAPDAFSKSLSMSEVLTAVKGTGFITS
ncbi:MAG TPA: ferritin-like domain-containing protein, partial [Methylobacterium sp.]|nr:ferritin-like domain-containing protein [Methylobacterium sp.]